MCEREIKRVCVVVAPSPETVQEPNAISSSVYFHSVPDSERGEIGESVCVGGWGVAEGRYIQLHFPSFPEGKRTGRREMGKT